jgi:hypothetical protein
MDGKNLHANESATLVQSIAAVAEELIPLGLIGSDMRRCLEGARLVLGLVLHHARKPEERIQRRDSTEASQVAMPALPFLSAYHTVDLRDAMTFEPRYRLCLD